MPVVIVTGITGLADTGAVLRLRDDLIPAAIASVDELELRPDQVSVKIILELNSPSSRPEVIVFVDGLDVRAQRTKQVQDRLAEAVVRAVINIIAPIQGKDILVEVFVRPHDSAVSGTASTIVTWRTIPKPNGAPFCDICGHITVLNGDVYKCLNCGNVMG